MSASTPLSEVPPMNPPAPTRQPARRRARLGADALCLSRREGAALGLASDGRVVRADAVAVLRSRWLPRDRDSRPRPGLGTWSRRFWPRAIFHHRRRPDRLPLVVLPVPHPDGHPRRQPVRRPGAAEDRRVGRPRSQRGRGPAASSRSSPTRSRGAAIGPCFSRSCSPADDGPRSSG
jgi:hypothetical protein